MYSEQLSQALAIADKYDPASVAASTVTTTGVKMDKGKRLMYEIQVGAISAGGTLDAKLQSATDSAFTSAHDITGASITQVIAANKRVTLEVRDDQVNQDHSGDIYVRLSMTVGTNNIILGATGWLGETEQKPANQYDIASVSQRKVSAI